MVALQMDHQIKDWLNLNIVATHINCFGTHQKADCRAPFLVVRYFQWVPSRGSQ
jgi:hypothetical protein